MATLRVLFLLFVGLVCASSQAQTAASAFSNLRVIANPAFSGAPLVARMQYNFCYGTTELPGATQAVRAGNVVTLTVNMVPQPGVICFSTPPPTSDRDFPLGSFAPGTYTLIENSISPTPGVTYPALTTTFVVQDAVNPIPMLSPRLLAALALALLSCGWLAIGWRSQFRRF